MSVVSNLQTKIGCSKRFFTKKMSSTTINNLGQYDRPIVLGCKPVDGVLVVHSSNQIYIATFVHQMGVTHISQNWLPKKTFHKDEIMYQYNLNGFILKSICMINISEKVSLYLLKNYYSLLMILHVYFRCWCSWFVLAPYCMVHTWSARGAWLGVTWSHFLCTLIECIGEY